MSAQLIDGKQIAAVTKEQVATQISEHLALNPTAVSPGLAVILVGNDPASEVYVGHKRKACQQIGINSEAHFLNADCSQQQLLELIAQLNNDARIHGILVQLPLPAHIDQDLVIDSIAVAKDVDGFHPYNLGRLAQKRPTLRPCTPFGVVRMLEAINYPLMGKDAVVVGASNIVGRPMALELLLARATTTVCHSKTKDLAAKVKAADVVISAVGIANFIKGEWIKEQAVVIDVGITRAANGKLCGDVEFLAAKQRASYITPVPGGVGPMTVAMLMENTFNAYLQQTG